LIKQASRTHKYQLLRFTFLMKYLFYRWPSIGLGFQNLLFPLKNAKSHSHSARGEKRSGCQIHLLSKESDFAFSKVRFCLAAMCVKQIRVSLV